LTLAIGGAFGAFFAEAPGWVRSDLSVRLELGVRVHPHVVVQMGLLNSTERLAPTVRAAALWFPFERWLYGKLGLDVTMAGAGVQPGVSGAIGVAWWSPVPLGLFVELEAAGRVTEPLSVDLSGAGGVFAYF
jgi:hypothetical protein